MAARVSSAARSSIAKARRSDEICVFGAHPLLDPEMASALVSLAAVRVSAELEHRQQQSALARSEAYSKAIVATAAEGIITLDARGQIESVNRAAEKMFGYEARELIGRNVNVLMPEPYRDEHKGYVERYVATGEGTICGAGREEVPARKDGTEFLYLAASEIVLDGERCFAGIMRDISEQKKAEEARKAVEQRFRAVLEQRRRLSGILSVDGRVLEANRKSRQFGWCGRRVGDRTFLLGAAVVESFRRDAAANARCGPDGRKRREHQVRGDTPSVPTASWPP